MIHLVLATALQGKCFIPIWQMKKQFQRWLVRGRTGALVARGHSLFSLRPASLCLTFTPEAPEMSENLAPGRWGPRERGPGV